MTLFSVIWRTPCSLKPVRRIVERSHMTDRGGDMQEQQQQRDEQGTWTAPAGERRRADHMADMLELAAQADPPMEAYRACAESVRMLLAPHIEGEAEINSVTAAIMTCAQDYALAMARISMEARATYRDGATQSPEPPGSESTREPLADS